LAGPGPPASSAAASVRKPLQPGTLVEVTTRTVQGRLLMVPEPTLNRSILGVLGRAQRLYPVQIHAYVFAGITTTSS
jgi:hypothetical protein